MMSALLPMKISVLCLIESSLDSFIGWIFLSLSTCGILGLFSSTKVTSNQQMPYLLPLSVFTRFFYYWAYFQLYLHQIWITFVEWGLISSFGFTEVVSIISGYIK